jgi:hypothetical protein
MKTTDASQNVSLFASPEKKWSEILRPTVKILLGKPNVLSGGSEIFANDSKAFGFYLRCFILWGYVHVAGWFVFVSVLLSNLAVYSATIWSADNCI